MLLMKSYHSMYFAVFVDNIDGDNIDGDNDDENNTDENFSMQVPRSLSSLSSCSDGDEEAFRANGTVYPAGEKIAKHVFHVFTCI